MLLYVSGHALGSGKQDHSLLLTGIHRQFILGDCTAGYLKQCVLTVRAGLWPSWHTKCSLIFQADQGAGFGSRCSPSWHEEKGGRCLYSYLQRVFRVWENVSTQHQHVRHIFCSSIPLSCAWTSTSRAAEMLFWSMADSVEVGVEKVELPFSRKWKQRKLVTEIKSAY